MSTITMNRVSIPRRNSPMTLLVTRWLRRLLALVLLAVPAVQAENYNPCMCTPPIWELSTAGPEGICPGEPGSWTVSVNEVNIGVWECDGQSGIIRVVGLRNVNWVIDGPFRAGLHTASGVGTTATWTPPQPFDQRFRGTYTIEWRGFIDLEPEIADCSKDVFFKVTKTFEVHPRRGEWLGATTVVVPVGTSLDIPERFRNPGPCTEEYAVEVTARMKPRVRRWFEVIPPAPASFALPPGDPGRMFTIHVQNKMPPNAPPDVPGFHWIIGEYEAGTVLLHEDKVPVDQLVVLFMEYWILVPNTPGAGGGGPHNPDDSDGPYAATTLGGGGGYFERTDTFTSDGRHRSVDVYGVPRSESSPTGEEESDRAPDNTVIDMLTLSPSYSVTDLSLPCEGGEMSIEVRRRAGIRSMDAAYDPIGARVNKKVVLSSDNLLGFGWSCSLEAKAIYDLNATGTAQTCVVTDELGQQLVYEIGFAQHPVSGLATPIFSPQTLSGWNHDAFSASLTTTAVDAFNQPTELTLVKRYGTTVVYEMTGTYTSPDATQYRNVFRVKRVVDRNGNALVYDYLHPVIGNIFGPPFTPPTDPQAGDKALLVSSIHEEDHPQRALAFAYSQVTPLVPGRDRGWRLLSASDPSGRSVVYDYAAGPTPVDEPSAMAFPDIGDRPGLPALLASVTRPADVFDDVGGSVSPVTTFTYHARDVMPELVSLVRGTTVVPVIRFVAPATITDARGHQTSFTYQVVPFPSSDASGNLEPALCLSTLTTSAGTMQVVNDERTTVYDSSDLLIVRTHVIDTAGTQVDYRFESKRHPLISSQQNLVKVQRTTHLDATTTAVATFEYANTPAGNLTRVADINGNVITYDYTHGDAMDPTNGPVQSSPAFFSDTERPNIYQLMNLPCRRVVDPGGLNLVTDYRHDPNFRALIRQVDATGSVTTHTLDARGNRTAITEAVGDAQVQRATIFEYAPDGFMTATEDPDQRRTEMVRTFPAFSATGAAKDRAAFRQVITRKVLGGGLFLTSTAIENLYGDQLISIDGNGNRTDLVYDAHHRLRTTVYPAVAVPPRANAYAGGTSDSLRPALPTDLSGATNPGPDGVRTRSDIFYDRNGNAVRAIDENGHVSLTTYDFHNRPLTSRQRMASPTTDHGTDLVTSTTYTARGQAFRSTDARMEYTEVTYDALLRPVLRDLPPVAAGGPRLSEHLIYGPNSGAGTWSVRGGWQPTRVINARGFATDTVYDAIYRSTRVVRRRTDGNDVAFNAAPRDASGAAPAETSVETDYNRLHQPIRVRVRDSQLPNSGMRVSLTYYDALHRPTVQVVSNDFTPGQAPQLVSGPLPVVNNPIGFVPPGLYERRVVRTTYDQAGNIRFVYDPQGRITERRYDGAGRLVMTLAPEVPDASQVGAPLATPISEVAYDAASNPVITTDARGTLTLTVHDARNRVVGSILDLDGDGTFETNGDDIAISTVLDFIGQPVQTTDPRGSVTDLTRDAAGRVVRTELPAVADAEAGMAVVRPVLTAAYDANGNAVESIDPKSVVTSTVYDPYNRPVIVTVAPGHLDSVSTRSNYDENGNVVAVVLMASGGGDLQTTAYTYDAFDRKLSETLPAVADLLPRVNSWTYGTAGDALTVTDPKGNRVATRYDGFGQAVFTQITAAGGVVEQERRMSYTLTGKLSAVEETEWRGSGPSLVRATTYTYDALDRQTGESFQSINGSSPEADHGTVSGYDLTGNRVVVTADVLAGVGAPATVRTTRSTFDRVNRVETITDGGYGDAVSTYTYDLGGNRLSLVRPGGIVDAYQYDALSRVTLATTTSPTAGEVYRVAYRYDVVGNRRQADETTATLGLQTTLYGYDNQYRLTSEVGGLGNRAISWTYDVAGNRTRQVETVDGSTPLDVITTTTDYHYDALNRLLDRDITVASLLNGVTSSVAVTYAYDRNGNRIEEAHSGVGGKHHSLAWDALNRLIGVRDVAGARDLFIAEYDARTRRRVTVEDPTLPTAKATSFRYDGGDCYQEQVAGAGTVVFTRGSSMGGGIGGILYSDRRTSGGPVETFAYNPAVGHTVVTVNETGAVQSANRYEAFGKQVATFGASANNRLANTKERTALIGLDNHGFRYYDPDIGRYISRDPLGLSAGINVYAYVGNDPVNSVDPLGLIDRDKLVAEHQALASMASSIKEAVSRGWDASSMQSAYLARYNQLAVDSAAFLDEQWITSSADLDAAGAYQSLPITFKGVAVAQGEISAAMKAQGQAGKAIEATADSLATVETTLEVVQTAGEIAGVATGVGGVVQLAVKKGVGKAAQHVAVRMAEAQIEGAVQNALVEAGVPGAEYLSVRLPIGKASRVMRAQRGPKTDPTAPHNAKIRSEADALAADGNIIIAGGGRLPEKAIPTPGGHKGSRRPDILYETPDGTVKGRNVGKTKADGTPVTREQQAMEDLNGAGVETDFTPYDR